MLARFARTLILLLAVGCVAASGAWASESSIRDERAKALADTALYLLNSVDSVHVGSAATVVTIEDGSKSHPIVIDYSNALGTGGDSATARGDSPSADKDATSGARSKGFTLGQIGAALLGLTVIGRTLRIVRQVAPARTRVRAVR